MPGIVSIKRSAHLEMVVIADYNNLLRALINTMKMCVCVDMGIANIHTYINRDYH